MVSKAEIKRDKRAVLTILADGAERSFPQIALQGGEGLYPACQALRQEGKIVSRDDEHVSGRTHWRLA